MLDDLRAIDWRGARRADGDWEKAHGRIERRVPPKAPPRCATPGEPPRPQADKTPRILPDKPDDPPTRPIESPASQPKPTDASTDPPTISKNKTFE